MIKKFLLITVFFAVGFNSYSQRIAKLKITDVEKYLSVNNGDILVINFWATFCKPCVAEIPSFIRTVDKYKGSQVKLLLVSLDLPSYYPAKIASFVKKNNFNTNIAWLEETNADYFCPKIDSSWSGSIPATLIVNTKTGYRKFFEGEMKDAEFEAMLKEVIAGSAEHSVIKDKPAPATK